MQPDITKQCSRCEALKRADEFLPKKSWCRECRSTYLKAYYVANKETLVRRSKEYVEKNRQRVAKQRKAYSDAHVEQQATRSREWYEANRDKTIAAASQWRRDNREKRAEYIRAYSERNREKLAAQRHANYEANKAKYAAKSRAWANANPDSIRTSKVLNKAKRKGAEGSFTKAEWVAVKRSFANRCACCGQKHAKDNRTSKLTADHVIPLALGGTNYISNIQPLCASCNSKKSAHHTADYRVRPFTGIAQLALI